MKAVHIVLNNTVSASGCRPGTKRIRSNIGVSKRIIINQKAFDSFPHSWVEKSIELVGMNSKIVRYCKLSMEKWNTRLILKTKQEVMQSQPIQIRRGIFQGYNNNNNKHLRARSVFVEDIFSPFSLYHDNDIILL